MKARHEFTSDRKYYNYLKAFMSIEFIKAAIISDNGDEDTIAQTSVRISNLLIEELIRDNKISEIKKEENEK